MSLKIGTLAVRTGTNPPTIRYYEDIGLLPRPARHQGGQRRYGQEDVRRLTFIRRCREFGFSIERIRELSSLMHDPGRSCLEAKEIAEAHLAEIREKLTELLALERSVAEFVTACESACCAGPGPDCAVLEDLSSP
jgi:DNA-binding transcriptional MerR regulator